MMCRREVTKQWTSESDAIVVGVAHRELILGVVIFPCVFGHV